MIATLEDISKAISHGVFANTPGNLEILLGLLADARRERVERAAHLVDCYRWEAYDKAVAEGIALEEYREGARLSEVRKFDRLVSERVAGSPEYGS